MRSVPERDRSKNTVQRLLEAARQEFSENGYEAARTPRVAERAGVSVGTLYRYFQDKQDLLVKLTEDLVEMDESTIMQPSSAAKDPTPQQVFMDGLARYLDVLAAQRDILKTFLEASYHDPEFMRMSWRWEFRAVEILASRLADVSSKPPGDIRAAALVIEHAIFRTMVLGDLYGRVGEKAVPEWSLRSELLTMIARYLGFQDFRVPGLHMQQEIQVKSKG